MTPRQLTLDEKDQYTIEYDDIQNRSDCIVDEQANAYAQVAEEPMEEAEVILAREESHDWRKTQKELDDMFEKQVSLN